MSSGAPNELEWYAQAMDALNLPSNKMLKTHEFESKLRMYDHPEGFDVAGKEKKQWLYLHCTKCGRDYSLKKILFR